jgi:hypothetical protein
MDDNAYQRGQSDALVQMIREQLQTIHGSVREIQQGMQQIREERVTRGEWATLTGTVEGLSRWRWTVIGGTGLLATVAQVLPKLLTQGGDKP